MRIWMGGVDRNPVDEHNEAPWTAPWRWRNNHHEHALTSIIDVNRIGPGCREILLISPLIRTLRVAIAHLVPL
jgi:hypothetical protein